MALRTESVKGQSGSGQWSVWGCAKAAVTAAKGGGQALGLHGVAEVVKVQPSADGMTGAARASASNSAKKRAR